MIGEKIGRLTIISECTKEKNGQKKRFLTCKCECGKQTEVRKDTLKSGQVQSCGCLAIEILTKVAKKMGDANKTHGMTKTRIYKIWCGMKRRCRIQKDKDFKNYGGRGISFDPSWENFIVFYNDMKEGYSDNLTLERLDVNGNYSKENCVWATNKQQQINRRNAIFVTYKGDKKRISDWADTLGISVSTLKSRRNLGWSDKEIIEGRKK